MIKYIASSANIKAANKLVSVTSLILTATAGNAVATLKSGGASGTTVGDIRISTSGNTVQVDFEDGIHADYLVLANGVALISFY